jgi:hypothetical protein
MRLVARDVELPQPAREVDRIEIRLTRGGEGERRESEREKRDARTKARARQYGFEREASAERVSMCSVTPVA